MKSKKSFLTFGIIALVLFLGVGYAVVSSVYLNIGGTASVNDQDLKVEITDAKAITSIADKTVDFSHVLSNKNLTSNFTLNEMQLGEIVTITYTVTNNETDVDAQLSLADGVTLSNSNEDYFNVSYHITDNVTDLKNNDKTMEVDVIVELIKTPVVEANSSTSVGLTLTASPKGGSTGAGSGTEVEATDIYYNQPYNAVVSTETVASDTATYAKNGQAYNVTNLYSNISELQVNARALAETSNQSVKTLVVYEDFTVEVFVDGIISATYPSTSVKLEGQKLNVTDVFEAEISSDFKTITIGEEAYQLNTSPSSLKVGPEHTYFMGYPEETPGQLMAMAVAFKSNTHLDVYFNGNLFGQTSTEYYTVGNVVYVVEGGEPSLYGYVSLDGTQFIAKGIGVYTYQGKDKIYYARAYTNFANYDDDDSIEKGTYIVYRDGSADLIIDWLLVETLPPGSIEINGDFVGSTGKIIDDGYTIMGLNDGEETGYGFILENIRKTLYGSKYNLLVDGNVQTTYDFDSNTFTDGNSLSGSYVMSDKSIIISGVPYILNYDESTGIYSSSVADVKLVPVS